MASVSEVAAERIAALLRERGVAPALLEPLAEYGAFVLAANRRMSLTGAKTAEELAEHLIDSLTVVPFVDAGPLVDVGSGAGFPAIPVAIATGCHATLIEAVGKKAQFLAAAVKRAGVNAVVLCERAETLAARPDLREQFAVATIRAVSNACTSLELTVPFLKIGGRVVLQRGALDARERSAMADAALVLGAVVVAEIELSARGDGETRGGGSEARGYGSAARACGSEARGGEAHYGSETSGESRGEARRDSETSGESGEARRGSEPADESHGEARERDVDVSCSGEARGRGGESGCSVDEASCSDVSVHGDGMVQSDCEASSGVGEVSRDVGEALSGAGEALSGSGEAQSGAGAAQSRVGELRSGDGQSGAPDGGRRLVIVEKRSVTPQRFPRRVGIPEKRPLCL